MIAAIIVEMLGYCHGCPPFCWKAHECWLVGCPVEVCKKFGDCLYKIIVTVCVRAGQVYLNAF